MASSINLEKESSLFSGQTSRLNRCQSMSDIKGNRFILSDSQLKARSNLVIWAVLLEHSKKALNKQEKKLDVMLLISARNVIPPSSIYKTIANFLNFSFCTKPL